MEWRKIGFYLSLKKKTYRLRSGSRYGSDGGTAATVVSSMVRIRIDVYLRRAETRYVVR